MEEATTPLFQQIAALIADAIVDGSLQTGDRAPSTNELADFHSINPATARKGLTLLVDEGVLEKRRGIGMFVTDNARKTILSRRRADFATDFIAPAVSEAVKLGVTRAELIALLIAAADEQNLT